MGEMREILIGLAVVGVGLALKVLRDGIKEIEQLRGAVAYTQEEAARFVKEKTEIEAETDEIRSQVNAIKQEVTSLEQRTATMKKVVQRKKEAIEKEKQSPVSRASLIG
jgi:predicted nuclease with TOPRIM domain